MRKKPPENLSVPSIRLRIFKFCAYQDRSEKEVFLKLKEFGFPEIELLDFIEELKKENYLDEERFCRAFVRGKFKQKNWGKQKVLQGLLAKGVNRDLAKKVIDMEIGDEAYSATLQKLIARKEKEWERLPEAKRKLKIKQFLFQKGY